MRYAAFAAVLILLGLDAWARREGWFALPDVGKQALLLCLPLTLAPMYLQGLREGELAMPHMIRRRDTPRLFLFAAVFQAFVIVTLAIYLGAGLLRMLAAG